MKHDFVYFGRGITKTNRPNVQYDHLKDFIASILLTGPRRGQSPKTVRSSIYEGGLCGFGGFERIVFKLAYGYAVRQSASRGVCC